MERNAIMKERVGWNWKSSPTFVCSVGCECYLKLYFFHNLDNDYFQQLFRKREN